MIDSEFFWKINSNYSRLCIDLEVIRLSRFGPLSRPFLLYRSSQVKRDGVELVKLMEDNLLICYPTVLDFSFGKKRWGKSSLLYIGIAIQLIYKSAAKFVVTNIEEIDWLSLPFDSLSISDEQRDVIMVVVKACNGLCNPSLAFDDVIAGKGRGLNILLQYSSVLFTLCQDTNM